jgi:hypothetical protein
MLRSQRIKVHFRRFGLREVVLRNEEEFQQASPTATVQSASA